MKAEEAIGAALGIVMAIILLFVLNVMEKASHKRK